MILIIVRPTLEYSRLLKAGDALGLEDLVHVFSPVPCTGWGEGQVYEEDVEKDKQDEMNEKDGKLIALLDLSAFRFSFFFVP